MESRRGCFAQPQDEGPATPQKRWREDSQQHRGVMRGDSARSSAACTLWRRAGKIWAAQRIVKNMPARQNR